MDRRARRRQETIEEILRHAMELMASQGVGALTMADIARRLGVAPPSLYKYFGSLIEVYDTLFRRGHEQNLQILQDAIGRAEPGMPALRAGLEATLRWAWDNPVLAQLLFWRPIPGFHPSAEAMAPTTEVVALLTSTLRQAIERRELSPHASSDQALALLSVLHFGALSQHLANEPATPWDESPYAQLLPQLLAMFTAAYPPG